MNQKHDIFHELETEITDFDSGYYLAGENKTQDGYDRNKKGEKGGYFFSQKETLESCDLAVASKYKKGIRDEEGQRKTFINIVAFYRDVMKMKININVANYIFEPRFEEATWPVWLMGRKFQTWAQEESYDDQIDEYGHSLATYGSTVSKKCAGGSERVPLRTMRNTQTAKSLWHAASSGGYVHIEDDKHYNEMKAYPAWNVEGLSKGKSYNTVERWALVPKKMLEDEAWRENGGVLENYDEAEDEMVTAYMVLIPGERAKGKETPGTVLFMEEIDEENFQLEECHAEREDGRWLGKGEVEKQLENQIARNLTANLRRRGLLWAVKKIFQSSDDEVANQLLMEVRDGEVLYVKPNGQISQVNTANQHNGDFSSDEEMWKENSQQRAFAFNIATGENLPSGTSFSLGVVLDRAVSSHFGMVRNTYSNFLKRSFFDQLMDLFIGEYSDEHTQQFPIGASDIENLEDQIIQFHKNVRIFSAMADRSNKPVAIDEDAIRQDILKEMALKPWLFVDIPEDFYDYAHAYMRLNIDDDIGPDVQTLTTLWQTYMQRGEIERADKILRKIMAKQGKNLSAIVGGDKKPAPVRPVNDQNPNPGTNNNAAPAPAAPAAEAAAPAAQ